jgi:hypothetical protein
MSVDRADYIIYGWKLPYELQNSNGEDIDLWDDKFLPMIEGHQGEKFTIVTDGMSGEYTVFGLNIAHSSSYDGWDFYKLNFDNIISKEELKLKYKELFDSEIEEDPYLFIFSHFS